MTEPTTTVTATLPDDLYERFAATAALRGLDEEELLVELVCDHVELAEFVITRHRSQAV
jgi:hypothetical protein